MTTIEPVAGRNDPISTAATARSGQVGTRRCDGSCGFIAASLIIVLLVLAPIVSLVVIAAGGSTDIWPHLAATVLPPALRETALLLVGVGIIVVVIGAGSAWLVTALDFPGRKILDWALLLPLAVPTYIVAFSYLDILHPIGPVQSTLRALLGVTDPRQFQLPEIRSLGGAVLLFGFVLYPYVYLSTRAMFLMHAAGLFDAARTLGAGQGRIFFRIGLPLARPAIALGTSLALMETLNDVGASEFLGIRTLTVSVYSTWINRSSLAGAAQIALLMLIVVVALIAVERWARRHRHYASTAVPPRPPAPRRLTGAAALGAFLLGLIPVLFGFLVPGAYLFTEAARRVADTGISPRLIGEIGNTLATAAIATLLAVILGTCVAWTARLLRGRSGGWLLRAASLGYALPGTVLAVGILGPVTSLDNALSDAASQMFGISMGLVMFGSGAALIYAYLARFLAISVGSAEAGLQRISVSLEQSARTLGHSVGSTLRRIDLPLLRPALGAAALLVFVDCMKELPATLLLRPVNFETLATHLYAEASRGTYEDGALAALCIVLVGLLPVAFLARMSSGGRLEKRYS